MSRYDVVIIGAGHNGLTAGNYLADAGFSVLVVEAADDIGGMSASGTPIAGAPHHVVNYCAVDLLFWSCSPVPAELGLDRYGLTGLAVDPVYAYLDPDGASLALWRDPFRTAAEIRRFSPHDAEAFLRYAAFISAFESLVFPLMVANPLRPDLRAATLMTRAGARHVRLLKQFGAFALASGDEIIDEHFRHPVTRSALHTLAAAVGPPSSPGTAIGHLALAFVHGKTVLRPVGGLQSIPRALAARFVAAGGEIRTAVPVAEICVGNGRAEGVTLADGSFLGARAVLATCDPRTTLERLLPVGTLSPRLEGRVKNIPANSAGIGQMKVDIALSGTLRLTRHHRLRADDLDLRIPCCFIGTPEGTRRSFALSAAGLLPEPKDIGLWTAVPTAVDHTQAPDGQDTLYLYSPAMPLQPDHGWTDLADKAATAIIAQASEYYEGINELEIGRWVEPPPDMAKRTGATNGCWAHVDWNIFRVGPFRPAPGLGGYKMPVHGLYHGGAGSHPGVGVTGLPGRNAARVVKRILKTSGRQAARSSSTGRR